MPTYKRDATEFTVSVWQEKSQQVKTTVPKPLMDLLDGRKEIRGAFILTRTRLIFLPKRSNTETYK